MSTALLLLALLQPAPAAAPQAGGVARVQMGVAVVPETVSVGDPFRVTVRVRAPAGATIELPQAPDSAADVEALDSPRIDSTDTAGGVERTAVYRLVAWNVGTVDLRLPDVRVRLAGGEEQSPSLASLTVQVRSVLPADTSLHVPKPQRPPFAVPIPWWIWALLALAALALLALLVWLWRRRRRPTAPALVLDPYEAAQREFARVEALGLLEAGERGRYAALVVDVVREYLAARVGEAPLSLTSRELLAAVRGRASVPSGRLAPLLEEVDQVKFARRPVTAERAREIGREARAIVTDTDQAERRRAAGEPEGGAPRARAGRAA